jgi:hypothetical protein
MTAAGRSEPQTITRVLAGVHGSQRKKQILRLRPPLDATGVHKTDLTAIRKKRGWVRDDSGEG